MEQVRPETHGTLRSSNRSYPPGGPGCQHIAADPLEQNAFGIMARAIGFNDLDNLARQLRPQVGEGNPWRGELIRLCGERHLAGCGNKRQQERQVMQTGAKTQ